MRESGVKEEARGATGSPRLPAPPGQWLFRDPIARLWLRPWFDRAALRLIARWYLPLSRAWAAALAADGEVERFWRGLPQAPRGADPLLTRALAQVARRRRAYDLAVRNWEEALFAAAPMPVDRRVQAELDRRRAAERLMMARAGFLPLALRRRLPAVRFNIPTPAEMARRQAARLAGPAFPAPERSAVETSRRVPGPYGSQHWLRFASEVAGEPDTAWARVFEPEAALEPPTLIFLHGITMEMEFWPDSRDPIPQLTGRGLRVVRVEGPWHGRRRPEGFYGGEPTLARAPLGMVELFQAWVAEIAQLIRWARETSSGPVAVAGISLGALTSQLVASAAAGWPAECRPDAALLVCTSGDVSATVSDSGLAQALGLPKRLLARGWTPDAIQVWRRLVEPDETPGLPPERVVMVLGSKDVVTPFKGGLALAERWQVPAGNRFVWARGHFSAGLGLMADAGPIARLSAALDAARRG
jgi:pimeloyl-ACP methyl ester carboxylesterase